MPKKQTEAISVSVGLRCRDCGEVKPASEYPLLESACKCKSCLMPKEEVKQ